MNSKNIHQEQWSLCGIGSWPADKAGLHSSTQPFHSDNHEPKLSGIVSFSQWRPSWIVCHLSWFSKGWLHFSRQNTTTLSTLSWHFFVSHPVDDTAIVAWSQNVHVCPKMHPQSRLSKVVIKQPKQTTRSRQRFGNWPAQAQETTAQGKTAVKSYLKNESNSAESLDVPSLLQLPQ